MSEQQFHRGDLVRIAADLGPTMRHFTADCDAVVIGSYADQFGKHRGGTDTYTLHLKGNGQVSWYYAGQLTLIERSRIDKLEEWERDEAEEARQKSDLDWIFANGAEVLKSAHGATVQALADCMGLGSLWGSRGEGIDYYCNAMVVLQLAKPHLEAGDRAGWDAACASMKAST